MTHCASCGNIAAQYLSASKLSYAAVPAVVWAGLCMLFVNVRQVNPYSQTDCKDIIICASCAYGMWHAPPTTVFTFDKLVKGCYL